MTELIVNGNKEQLEVNTLLDVVSYFDLLEKPIIVEVDGQAVGADEWDQTKVHDQMVIEIVHFVGGG